MAEVLVCGHFFPLDRPPMADQSVQSTGKPIHGQLLSFLVPCETSGAPKGRRIRRLTLGDYTLPIVTSDRFGLGFRFSSILRCCNNGQHGFDRLLPGYQRWRT